MDEQAIAAYRAAVRAGKYAPRAIAAALGLTPQEAARIARTLLDLRLLHPVPGDRETLAPASPDSAAADLVGPAEQRIRELQQSVSSTRNSLLSLLPVYFESRRSRNRMEAFDVITNISVLEVMIEDFGARCQSQALTVQPGGPRPPHLLEGARRRTLERLARGIRVEHLYQHTVRNDPASTAYIREVTAAGAEVRTTDQLIDRMIIYDREIVFLPEQGELDRRPGAIVVREPTLVAFLCKLYDQQWAQGTVFEPDAEDGTAITDDVQRSIIKLMAQGYKDEMVARRLGMSVRTCRRHIAEIMEDLDATSRFQAGVNVALSGALDEAVGRAPRGEAQRAAAGAGEGET
ncbi:LuxR C-terminal-related transcriptional regulator [Streptomyces sp. NPDC058308]|uniref:helix-turn-helix transcriptional regulator n=1 Tax=Streptomyces sp. NPDC058308 TaxID=3346440 RepID=UPI0036F0C990